MRRMFWRAMAVGFLVAMSRNGVGNGRVGL